MQQKIKDKFNYLKTHPNSGLRISVGLLLILGGFLGALPILGFWMLPLGLILLSVDFPWAKRAHLSLVVMWRRLKSRYRRFRTKDKN